ncbi:MAG TPA: 2-amino-4-hydroxy-6-hydroxymethyldihydropteridine diphosphokinase [Terriglobia bacterium]|nr:2-amino-4-hydroxy-6-hydroxymethyldihydropteridine diphosphokinase [Terriglobia bacterium]
MTVYLGLGSNLGDRIGYIRRAIEQLEARGVAITRAASIYETEPVDSPPEAPQFLNTTVEAQTSATPDALLGICLEIERQEGRVRPAPNAPRTLDIDILLFGNEIHESAGLVVPHPRYTERRFVLVPLNEIAPDVVDPARKQTVAELLALCSDETEVRLYGPPPALPAGRRW